MTKPEDTQTRYSILFRKYLNNACSKQEVEEVLNFIENPANSDFLNQEANSQFISIDKQSNDELKTQENQASMDHILDRIHHQIRLQEIENTVVPERKKNFFAFFAKAAAILILPIFSYAVYVTLKTSDAKHRESIQVAWQTVKTTAGMQTDFMLPDGSHVWLNSGSALEYPVAFAKNIRQVKLTGEAFFDVKKDPLHPFIVHAGKINIEVKGTRFNVSNYPGETHAELILETGSVRLFEGNYTDNKTLAFIKPGERALLDNTQKKLSVSGTDVEKYTSWKEGLLIFRDDKMDEVVRQLNKKFNVDIILQDAELKEYIYTATFQDESLTQILELLKISAPVNYVIYKPIQLADNSFSKQKIIITKRKQIRR
jgi:ferric-dicitrate binding protein FerR (iron transport regulator)